MKQKSIMFNCLRAICVGTIVLVSLSGCSKLLDKKPPNALTRDEFFKTRSDAEAALTGVYDALQACVEEFLVWGEYRSDLVVTNATSDRTLPYSQFLDYTKEGSRWDMVYSMIGRANIVIEAVPAIPALDGRLSAKEADAIVAEALFLRSLGYFYLVRTFGEVPLNLQAVSSDNVQLFLPKVSADSVLKQIEQDLIIADKTINTEYLSNLENRGRATKAAVNALQTDLYLWRGKYAEAAAAAKKVLANTRMYSLQPRETWFNIFAQKNTQESIFEVQFDFTLNERNGLRGYMGDMSINNVLLNYFTADGDKVRGPGGTYRRDNSLQLWKYMGLSNDGTTERLNDDPNFIVYRLADVMLMCAEAEAHLDDAGKDHAGELINMVHTRAGLEPFDFLKAGTPISIFIEVILKERAMELACEGKRWFDLVRFAKNEADDNLLINRIVQSRTVAERAQIRSRIIDPRSWVFPIHLDELTRNANLKQNPFYQ